MGVTWSEIQYRRLTELNADLSDLDRYYKNADARDREYQALEKKLAKRERKRLGGNKCLRPMLAPHLYFILRDLLRLWGKPVRILKVRPCFRKESQGAHHSSEFTMLNLVEMGLPEAYRKVRIRELAALVVNAAGVKNYKLETEKSEIYGETLDVVSAGRDIELGLGAMSPHPLDRPWKIADTWVGIGFGLERLLMASEKSVSLGRMERSLTYLDGIGLNV